jgi:hypothetical protein
VVAREAETGSVTAAGRGGARVIMVDG